MVNIVVRSLLTIYYGHILGFCSLTDIKGCGLRYRIDTHAPTISHGYVSRPSDYPWHVAIYRQFNLTDPPEYICGGSIIHHKLIVTAAHCVYDEDTFNISSATFTVITGKFNRSWDYHDSIEQRFKVIGIRIPQSYKGFTLRYGDDIAVLSLNETIKFSSVVLPICVSWDSEIELTESSDVTVVGWGLTEDGTLSNKLLTTQLKYFNFTACSNRFENQGFSQYVTDDKFCAGLENGTAVEQGDSGGGLIIPKNSTKNELRYYIVGIVSTRDSGTSITTFTNINKFRLWLNQTVLSFIQEGHCSPLISDSVELTQCKFNNTNVDCEKPAMPGTKAKVQCKNSFHAEFPYRPYTETECQKNLTWLPLMNSCLECGKSYKSNISEPLMASKDIKGSEFPWHVGVYRKHGEKFIYACGGTIIHPKVILISALCGYRYSYAGISDLKNVFVVAGKYNRTWSAKSNFEQRFEASLKIIHPRLATDRNNTEAYFGMLVLNDTVKINNYVMPACLDWSKKLKLLDKSYVYGLIAGWGITKEGGTSNILKGTEVLMIHHTRCSLRPLDRVLTRDQWCVISEDGSKELLGDVGGIVFPNYEEETGKVTYYLHGIASKIVSSDIEAVTDILIHENLIKQFVMYILKKGKSK